MDDNTHRENGRHKADHYKGMNEQWMIPQHQMKEHNHTIRIMNIMNERDRAIEERNLALSEKKAAVAERDLAMLQRDAAINERNSAIAERDSAIAALQYARENANGGSMCPPGCAAARGGAKHINHHQQHHISHMNSTPQLSVVPYDNARENQMHVSDAYPVTSFLPENSLKPRRGKLPKKEPKVQSAPSKKETKASRKNKRAAEDLNKQVTIAKSPWRGQEVFGDGEDLNKVVLAADHEWRGQDLSLNQVTFDETTMPIPGCSCTGTLRQCYKWGNGGWQSSCCTTTMSAYPLPVMPNKRHARVGGRKMSGSAFTKLLSRLAREGYDLSMPLDLKDHWAKHGTNRYITIK